MGLKIVYGRSGSGKTSYLLKTVVEHIDNGKKKYIVTPEQFSFTAEKELLKKMEDETKSSAVIAAEVLTFNRMAHRVMEEVGGTTQTLLSKSGKAMILYSILANHKDELKFLGNSDHNIDLILRQITELKKHGVDTQKLHLLKEQVNSRYLQEKLRDIEIIYQEYEKKITDQYIDESDDLTRLSEQLLQTDMFHGTEIYLDEFSGFTQQEYTIIEQLMKAASELTITVCTDHIQEQTDPDTDIFYYNQQMIQRIKKMANDHQILIEEVFLNQNKRSKNEELRHLEENLFTLQGKQYSETCQNIHLFLANNPYSEIENIAKKIVELVKQGYRYQEISMITNQIETYSSQCKAIFSTYQIPIYIDEKKKLDENIIVKYMLSVLEIFAKNWSHESVINYLKTGLTSLKQEEEFLLERYAKKWKIQGSQWYKEDWNFHDEKEFGEESMDRINLFRKELTEPLLKLREKLKRNKNSRTHFRNPL